MTSKNFPHYVTICLKISLQVSNMVKFYTWTPVILAYTALNSTTLSPTVVDYEPSIVHLAGILRENICPGPPEYASIEKGDDPEHIFVLTLDSPVHVKESTPKKDSWNEPEENVTEIQVAASCSEAQHLVGKHVMISGSLFHAITANHRTDVIMLNNSIELVK